MALVEYRVVYVISKADCSVIHSDKNIVRSNNERSGARFFTRLIEAED